MIKHFSFLKTLFVFLFCMVGAMSYADGILVFQVTDPKNKPLKDIAINVKGEGIDTTLRTSELGRYHHQNWPAGSYTYDVQYGDWAKGSFVMPDAEFEWVDINFRELSIHFYDEKSNNLSGESVKIWRLDNEGKEEYITTKLSDSTGVVTFTLPEGWYKYETRKGSVKVEVNDEVKTQEVPIASGIITHQTYFEFQKDSLPYKIKAKDIFIYPVVNGEAAKIPYGSVDAHSDDTDASGYSLYDRTENKISMASGIYIYEVPVNDAIFDGPATLRDTFEIKETDPIDTLVIPININFHQEELQGEDEDPDDEEEEKVEKKEKTEKEWDEELAGTEKPIKVEVQVETEDGKPLENVFTYLDMLSEEAPMPFKLTDGNGGAMFDRLPHDSYLLHVANQKIRLYNLQKDTVVKVTLSREKYSEVFFELQFEGEKIYSTSIQKVELAAVYETDSFYMKANFELNPQTFVSNDTTFYSYDNGTIVPLRLGGMDLNYWFQIDERKLNGRYGETVVTGSDTTVKIVYNIEPEYELKAVICRSDSTRLINTFAVTFHNQTKNYSHRVFTKNKEEDIKGEASTKTVKSNFKVAVEGVDTIIEVFVNRDTTVYFIYCDVNDPEDQLQRVFFKFLHGGEVVNPQVMSLEAYKVDTVTNKRTQTSVLVSDVDRVMNPETGKMETRYKFRDSMELKNGNYEAVYTLKDYYFNGECSWNFDIHDARGTDTTIYIVIPVKRNVEISISDANGEKVEGVFAQIWKYNEETKNYDIGTSYDLSEHGMLRTNANGVIQDHLLPGKYQLRILDIVRNFVVGDYDLSFDVLKGAPMKNVKFIVKNKNTQKTMEGLELVVNKGESLFSTGETSNVGEIDMVCEEGDYKYILNYGEGHEKEFKVTQDTIIIIYVEDEVKVESITLDAMDCVAEGDVMQIVSTVLPDTATRKQLKWTLDNEVLGTIDSEGNFTANSVGLSGFVTIKASASDGTNLFAEKLIQVGGAQCGAEITTKFENGEEEYKRTEDTITIVITPSGEDFDRYYVVQEKKDGKWVNIVGPTKDTEIKVPTDGMNEAEHEIRVISSTDTTKIKNGEITEDNPQSADKSSNVLKIKNSAIYFLPSVNGICEKQNGVEIEIGGEDINSLSAGSEIVWYVQTKNDDDFVEMPSARGQKSAVLNLEGETTIKVAIENGTTVLAKTQKTIVSEDSIKVRISSDKASVCYGDTIVLTANITNSEYGSILWENNSSELTREEASDSVMYKVVVESKLGYCPSATDSLRLIIDYPIVATLTIDKDTVCDNNSEVNLTVSIPEERSDLEYDWTGFYVSVPVLTDAPSANKTYTANINTLLGICPNVSLDTNVVVIGNVDFDAVISDAVLCKGEATQITITKSNGGQAFEDIDFTIDGEAISTNIVDVLANKTNFEIKATDKLGGCPDVVKNVSLIIDVPVEFELTQSSDVICDTDVEGVQLKATAEDGTAYSYQWTTNEATPSITVHPKSDSDYSVTVNSEHGKCPSITKSASVRVNESIKVLLTADVDRICQQGDDEITLTAEAEDGTPTSWIWWDGAVTTSPVRTFTPSASTTVWVRGNDNVCAVSEQSSLQLYVDVPHTAHLSTTSTKFVYGGSIDLVATFDGAVAGPLTWYSVDEDGNVSSLSDTEEHKFSDMPSGDVKYYVTAKNGACADVKSDMLSIALMDEVKIPTVFTPHELNGENDDFMPGYNVIIYDRFGNFIHHGDNGWDGTYRGETADAGVYVYTLTLKDGREKKGTIQVFKK